MSDLPSPKKHKTSNWSAIWVLPLVALAYAPVVPAPVGRMTPTALSTDTAISATADNRKRLFALRPGGPGSRRAHNANGVIRRYRHFRHGG